MCVCVCVCVCAEEKQTFSLKLKVINILYLNLEEAATGTFSRPIGQIWLGRLC